MEKSGSDYWTSHHLRHLLQIMRRQYTDWMEICKKILNLGESISHKPEIQVGKVYIIRGLHKNCMNIINLNSI
jgi:hypothetical protein